MTLGWAITYGFIQGFIAILICWLFIENLLYHRFEKRFKRIENERKLNAETFQLLHDMQSQYFSMHKKEMNELKEYINENFVSPQKAMVIKTNQINANMVGLHGNYIELTKTVQEMQQEMRAR